MAEHTPSFVFSTQSVQGVVVKALVTYQLFHTPYQLHFYLIFTLLQSQYQIIFILFWDFTKHTLLVSVDKHFRMHWFFVIFPK